MTKEMKIIPPEGYEVDEENSTFEYIKFKPIKSQLPKTWKEFCETHPLKKKEAFIGSGSSIFTPVYARRDFKVDRNTLPSKQYAEAVLAFCQLIQLRDCYNDGWQPDWNEEYNKWCIEVFRGKIDTATHTVAARVLTFKSEELRNEFLDNFKDLIETAKSLL